MAFALGIENNAELGQTAYLSPIAGTVAVKNVGGLVSAGSTAGAEGLSLAILFAGQVEGQSGLSGAAEQVAALTLTGEVSGLTTSGGGLNLVAALGGLSAGQSGLVEALDSRAAIQLAAQVSTGSTGGGSLALILPLAGLSEGQSSLTGTALWYTGLGGTVAALSNLSANVKVWVMPENVLMTLLGEALAEPVHVDVDLPHGHQGRAAAVVLHLTGAGENESRTVQTLAVKVQCYAPTVTECRILEEQVRQALDGQAEGKARLIWLDSPGQLHRRAGGIPYAEPTYKIWWRL